MPIITVQFIKDVVATPEQKRELIVQLTDTFVGILGDVVRPFVYCIIEETPQQEWGIAGVPMPDLVYLTSDKHAQVIGRSNDMMRGAIAQMAGGAGSRKRKALPSAPTPFGAAQRSAKTGRAAFRKPTCATGRAGSTSCGTRSTTTSPTSTSIPTSRRTARAVRTSSRDRTA